MASFQTTTIAFQSKLDKKGVGMVKRIKIGENGVGTSACNGDKKRRGVFRPAKNNLYPSVHRPTGSKQTVKEVKQRTRWE